MLAGPHLRQAGRGHQRITDARATVGVADVAAFRDEEIGRLRRAAEADLAVILSIRLSQKTQVANARPGRLHRRVRQGAWQVRHLEREPGGRGLGIGANVGGAGLNLRHQRSLQVVAQA